MSRYSGQQLWKELNKHKLRSPSLPYHQSLIITQLQLQDGIAHQQKQTSVSHVKKQIEINTDHVLVLLFLMKISYIKVLHVTSIVVSS